MLPYVDASFFILYATYLFVYSLKYILFNFFYLNFIQFNVWKASKSVIIVMYGFFRLSRVEFYTIKYFNTFA